MGKATFRQRLRYWFDNIVQLQFRRTGGAAVTGGCTTYLPAGLVTGLGDHLGGGRR